MILSTTEESLVDLHGRARTADLLLGLLTDPPRAHFAEVPAPVAAGFGAHAELFFAVADGRPILTPSVDEAHDAEIGVIELRAPCGNRISIGIFGPVF